jgi:hypothetical protein
MLARTSPVVTVTMLAAPELACGTPLGEVIAVLVVVAAPPAVPAELDPEEPPQPVPASTASVATVPTSVGRITATP